MWPVMNKVRLIEKYRGKRARTESQGNQNTIEDTLAVLSFTKLMDSIDPQTTRRVCLGLDTVRDEVLLNMSNTDDGYIMKLHMTSGTSITIPLTVKNNSADKVEFELARHINEGPNPINKNTQVSFNFMTTNDVVVDEVETNYKSNGHEDDEEEILPSKLIHLEGSKKQWDVRVLISVDLRSHKETVERIREAMNNEEFYGPLPSDYLKESTGVITGVELSVFRRK